MRLVGLAVVVLLLSLLASGTVEAGIVLNRMRGKEYEMSRREVEECLEIPVIATIHEDSRGSIVWDAGCPALSQFKEQ